MKTIKQGLWTIDLEKWDGETGAVVIRRNEFKLEQDVSFDHEMQTMGRADLIKLSGYGAEWAEIPEDFMALLDFDSAQAFDEVEVFLRSESENSQFEATLQRSEDERLFQAQRF